MNQPNARCSVESYRRLAGRYDASCAGVMSTRSHAVALLGLRPGDVVVDVASGTGLSFPPIMDEIGPTGHLIAIEHSPEMMALARERVRAVGWRNITLVEAAVEEAKIPCAFDAALFLFTHDVLQSSSALARLFAHAKPGARVAVAGARFTSWWLAPLNLWVMIRTRQYLTTYAGLDRPWRNLMSYVPGLMVVSRQSGMSYLAHGRFGRTPAEAASVANIEAQQFSMERTR